MAGMFNQLRDALIADNRGAGIGRGAMARGRGPLPPPVLPGADADPDDMGGPSDADMDDARPMPIGDRKIAPEDAVMGAGMGGDPYKAGPDLGDGADMDRERAIQAAQGAAAAVRDQAAAAGPSPIPALPSGAAMQALSGAGGQQAAFDELGLPATPAPKGLAGLFGRMTPAPRPPADSLAAVLQRAMLGARRR